ncbi:uncharacterized protein LOC144142057 [Haemaphysalis longicornis]
MTSVTVLESMAMNTEAARHESYEVEALSEIASAVLNMTADTFLEATTSTYGGRRRPGNFSSARRQNRNTAMRSQLSVAIYILDLLNAAYMPIVIYFGLIGNVLSLLTFLFTYLRNRTSSLYLGALAASDSGFLIVLSFAWLSERGINVYQQGLCQLLVFLSSAFSCWSVWLTVSFTAERFVAVRYPLWKLQTSSAKIRPRVVIGATALMSAVFNAHLLLFVGVNDGEFPECNLHAEYENVLYYLNILDTVLTFIVPFALIAFMNFMIGRSIYLFYARYKLQRSTSGHSSDDKKSFATTSSKNQNATVVSVDGTTTATSGGGIPHATQISVTRMLLLVSTVFMLLNLPSYAMRIYVFVLSLRHSETDVALNSLPFVLQRYFMLLYYTNFAINFVLYNASSRMFRIALCDYVRGRWIALRESIGAMRSSLGRSSTSQNEDIVI